MFIHPLSPFFLPHRLLRCPLFFLFIPSIAFLFERSPSRFISRSLCPCLAQSIYLVPSRCRTTSVGLITYSRHTWTALTGINHEQFQVPIQGSSDCLCWEKGPWSASPVPPVSCQICSFSLVSLVSTSAFTHFLTPSPLCPFNTVPT